MINVPKTLCKCNDNEIKQTILTEISSVDACYEIQCEEVEPVELVPILKTLCPCEPPPEVVVNFSPKSRKTKIIKTCFADFIKNITSTKFCNNGPTCKVS